MRSRLFGRTPSPATRTQEHFSFEGVKSFEEHVRQKSIRCGMHVLTIQQKRLTTPERTDGETARYSLDLQLQRQERVEEVRLSL